MRPEELGKLMAERTLTIGVQDITVRIGKPEPVEGSTDFVCLYQIRGVGDEKIRMAGGIDSVHAIQGVLEKVGIDLYAMNRPLGWAMRWDGGADGRDLGFPLREEIMAILEDRDGSSGNSIDEDGQ